MQSSDGGGRQRGERSTGEFIALVALLMSLVALAIDVMLPALPDIGRDLGTTHPNDVQLIVLGQFMGIGVGQLIFGPLSDRIGRRPAIQIGLTIFMAGCLLSVFAPTFEAMIAGRVLQGLGVAGPRIVSIALVRDQYAGRPMARIMSFTMAVFILVPIIAPALGQAIHLIAGWRAIFAAVFLVACVAFVWFSLRQPETLPPERRRPLSPRALLGSLREVLGTRTTVGYTVAAGFAFAPFVAYLSSAQQLFSTLYGIDLLFPAYFAALALAIGCASLVNGKLVLRYGMRRLARTASLSACSIALIVLAITAVHAGVPPLWVMMVGFGCVFACQGLLFGNLNALAMEPLGHVAGVGAAVVAALSSFISAPLGFVIGRSFDGTLYTQVGAFALFSIGSYTAMRWAARGAKAHQSDAPAPHGKSEAVAPARAAERGVERRDNA